MGEIEIQVVKKFKIYDDDNFCEAEDLSETCSEIINEKDSIGKWRCGVFNKPLEDKNDRLQKLPQCKAACKNTDIDINAIYENAGALD